MFFQLPDRAVEEIGTECDLTEEGGQPQGEGEGDDEYDPVGVQGCPPKAVGGCQSSVVSF